MRARAAALALCLLGCQLFVGIEDLQPLRVVDAGRTDGPVAVTDAPPADAAQAPRPSCVGQAATCGASHDQPCCAAVLVPGAAYLRQNDSRYPATVSSFYLDRYEVTVGRFRAFLASGPASQANPPTAGAGEHPLLGDGSGWDPSWASALAPTTAGLIALLDCDAASTYGSSDHDDDLPITCTTWFEAFAFCAWDGGRLPTDAEWNLAAAGTTQRLYPWGAFFDAARTVYCPGGDAGTCAPEPVGSRSPAGDTPLGIADLSGNAREMVLDASAPSPPMPCYDCATLGPSGAARDTRGGSWNASTAALVSTEDVEAAPAIMRYPILGFRCAYDR
jgi:formylglycine-generating enzyme required for sulfatase activity